MPKRPLRLSRLFLDASLFVGVASCKLVGFGLDCSQPLFLGLCCRLRLLASGIFHAREAEVVAAFEAAGLRISGRRAEDDWVALEAETGN